MCVIDFNTLVLEIQNYTVECILLNITIQWSNVHYNEVLKHLEEKNNGDVIYLDFSKAYDQLIEVSLFVSYEIWELMEIWVSESQASLWEGNSAVVNSKWVQLPDPMKTPQTNRISSRKSITNENNSWWMCNSKWINFQLWKNIWH